MNTRFLLTLRTIAQAGSLAAAARQLNLAVASVSEQVRALENDLGVPLLIRRGRSVVLTEAGEAAVAAATDVLNRIEDLRHRVQAGEPSGLLRVGSIPSELVNMLPKALRRMATRYPRIEMKVVPGTSSVLYSMVERGDIDCAVTPRPHFELPKSMVWLPVKIEPLALVVPSDTVGDSVEELLRREPFIRVDRRVWTGRLVTSFLEDHGLMPHELFELDAHEAVILLVAEGLGVALVHESSSPLWLGAAVRRLPIKDERYARVIGLIVARRTREGLARLLAGALTAGENSEGR
jgi:DNA-binding transcriptional LysR family regulator